MSKKRAQTKKLKSASISKARLPSKGGGKRLGPKALEPNSGGRRRSTKSEAVVVLSQQQEDAPSASTLPVAARAAPPLHDGDVSAEASAGTLVEGAVVLMAEARLPQVPTTLVRRNRHGVIQCECTVGPDGIFYKGQRYGSLSGAASAASKDLGLSPAVNGYVFFQLAKPARARIDAVERLRRLGNRYEEHLAALLMARSDEVPNFEVKAEIEAHRHRLEKILTVTAE